MEKVVGDLSATFSIIKLGKPSPSLVENIEIDIKGSTMVLKYCSIITSQNRRLLIQAYNPLDNKIIEKALRTLHGYNSRIEDHYIIIDFPPISDEYRASLITRIKSDTEKAKIIIRGIRKSAIDNFKKYPDSTPQKVRGWQKSIQELTDDAVNQIENISLKKINDLKP